MKFRNLIRPLAHATVVSATLVRQRLYCQESESPNFHHNSAIPVSLPRRETGEKARVGVIGGMGTEAATGFFNHFTKIQKILGAVDDRDFITTVSSNKPIIPDRTAFILHNGQDPIPALQVHMDIFRSWGMDVAGAVCNTFHAPQIVNVLQHNNPDIPLLNLVESTKIFVGTNYKDQNVGLMATDGTLAVDIYDNKSKITPDPEYQQKLMMAIYAIKAGYHEKDLTQSETREALLHILQKHRNTAKYTQNLTERDMRLPQKWLIEVVQHLQKKKADVIIMGCTEIPIALKPEDVDIHLVDTIKVLALSLAVVARNPSVIEYIEQNKHMSSWSNNMLLEKMYAVLGESLDLSKHDGQLSAFMGKSLTKEKPLSSIEKRKIFKEINQEEEEILRSKEAIIVGKEAIIHEREEVLQKKQEMLDRKKQKVANSLVSNHNATWVERTTAECSSNPKGKNI